MAEQLVLGMGFQEGFTLETFCDPTEGPIDAYLKHLLEVRSLDRFAYLWGGEGTGKTHLLQALCQEAQSRYMSAVYFEVAQLIEYPLDSVEGLEAVDLICLDDVEQLAGRHQWQEGIFNLYNRCRDIGTSRLVVSANCSPAQLPLELADLKSRLAWGASFKLEPLNDAMKKHHLKKSAHRRGFELNDAVIDYILTHYGRDMKTLSNLIDALDRASLSEHRKITIPFIKKTL